MTNLCLIDQPEYPIFTRLPIGAGSDGLDFAAGRGTISVVDTRSQDGK